MKHFFIIPNVEKPETADFSRELSAYIQGKGGTAQVAENRDFDGERFVHTEEIPCDTEAVIVLGGDGTIIQAARDTDERALPVMGVNMGTVGYLAQTDSSRALWAVDRLFADEYMIEERMMLGGALLRKGKRIYGNSGLNDIVLRTAGISTVEFEFCVNGELIKKYLGDGMILSTPTGSTAYNLSAGGPIVMPSASMILATPLNPHTMLQRSIVLPDDSEVVLRITGIRRGGVLLSFDGTVYSELACGDEIQVRKDEKKVRLLKLEKDSFLEVLRNKLE